MAHGLLVSFAGYPYTPSSLTLDNGLANLAGALASHGHTARILDLNTIATMRRLFPESIAERFKPLAARLMGGREQPSPQDVRALAALDAELEASQRAQVEVIADEVIAVIEQQHPAFVGFKLWSGDGFTGSARIAERVSEAFPDLRIYAGGPQAAWFREVIYGHTDVFDAICYSEGEAVIVQLAEHATGQRELASIPGIIFRHGGQVHTTARQDYLDLARLPKPLYDSSTYPAAADSGKMLIYMLDDSRGCPYRCGFCIHPVESGPRLRTRPADLLVDDIERMWRENGIRAFRFAGSSTPGGLMAQVAEEIISRGLDVEFSSFGHFSSTDPRHFVKLRQAGLRSIFFGIESGCQRVLDRAVRKGIDLRRIEQTVRAAQRAGIFVVTSMIVPLPFDTEETLQESLKLLLDIRPDSVPVQFPALLPHTPWYEKPEQYGFEVDKETFLPSSLGYKIKLLFPPQHWAPLPYRLNGMSYQEFTALTAWFASELERNGILTGVPDDNALVAGMAGMSAREFRDKARAWCLTGDWKAMQALTDAVNDRACAGSGCAAT